ncbi:MAG TPA: prolipoprotein diacylglyceryl transferase family protein [Kofleriaceae bacterium]|jgi:phosphatidylglycerol:prolipoprotein diacylglycerol transferase|nr:prolipoprotein diacylglyceryl transferase family protein [Kofleriaceae bacterium]
MSVLAASLPYFHLGALDLGIQIQSFGVIVATGVLIGAALLRRYAEWHGVDDEHIRGITGWITVAGFIGAHVFDVIAYQWNDLMSDPWLIIEVWKGISSYGGFIGGAAGFAIYVWWKRLPPRLFADIGIVGLLPAFSIGRIGCTVVSDHIGAAVDPGKWYSFLAMDYPRAENLAHLAEHYPGASEFIRAWNLGLVEFLYLVPVNILVLWLAFRTKKRPNAGFLIVLAAILYAPVRFGLDFLRPDETDPRYAGLTFAQWASIVAFGVAVYVAFRVLKHGAPAEVVARTSGEAQAKLKSILKETAEAKDDDEDDDKAKSKKASKSK